MTTDKIRILVGIDFSEGSRRALDEAVMLAQRLGGELELVHVLSFAGGVTMSEMVLSRSELDGLVAAREQLAALRQQRVPADLPVRLHLRIGDASTEMIGACEDLHPAMAIVGSHGRGPILRALLGSVSERLARHSPVPVLVIPDERRGVARAAAAARADEPPARPKPELAWSCAGCGHLRGRLESLDHCRKCHLAPGSWNSAPVVHGPVDGDAPAFGHGAIQGP